MKMPPDGFHRFQSGGKDVCISFYCPFCKYWQHYAEAIEHRCGGRVEVYNPRNFDKLPIFTLDTHTPSGSILVSV